MSLDTLNASIASIHSVTPRVKQFLLRVPGHEFDHRPGQHVTIQLQGDDKGHEYRPYSPVNLPGTDTLALAVKRYEAGTGSMWMHNRSIGDSVAITGPSGNLTLQDPDRDVAFLATGTGLTPMLALLSQYLNQGTGEAALLFGERTQRDLMYRETLDRLSASHSNLTVGYVLSEEDWSGPTGYVQEHLGLVLHDLEQPHVYLCGVPQMVVETQAVLEDAGTPADRIFTEGWEQGAVED